MTEAVRSFQHLLNAFGVGPIAVDGIIGPHTMQAYESLDDELFEIVSDGFVANAPSLRAAVLDFKSRPQVANSATRQDRLFYSWSDVSAAISAAAMRLQVPKSYLELMVDLENWTSETGVTASVDGTYRGVSQFGSRTWRSIQALYPELDLPSFEEGTLSLRTSIAAGAALYLENKRVFESSFPTREFSDSVAYLFHQQGGPAALQFLRTGRLKYPNQSGKSLALFDKVISSFVA